MRTLSFFAVFAVAWTVCVAQSAQGQTLDAAAEHLALAKVLFQRASYDSAATEVAAAIGLKKRFPEAFYWKGRIALQKGDLNTAEKSFQTARGQDKQYAEAYNGLGEVFRRRKNRKLDAIDAYQEALRLDPSYVEACYNLGAAYRDITFGDVAPLGIFKPFYLTKGIEALEKTLELDPAHPQANSDLGYIYEFGMNNIEKAMVYYTRQLDINPQHAESMSRLGQGFFKTGKLGEGVGAFSRLVRKYPEMKAKYQPVLTMLEAMLHLKNRAYDRAQTAFDDFIATLSVEEQALYADISLIAPEEEVRRYNAMNPERQPEYRRQFWKQRDADPTTSANERLIEHYRRVLFARTNFGEKRFPWDRRGELYIRYGEPDDRQQFTFGIGEKQDTNQGSSRPTSVPTVQSVSDDIRESNQTHLVERQAYAPTGNARVDAIREMNFQQRFQLAVEASTVGLSAYRAESWVYVPMGTELFFVDQLNNGVFDFPLDTQSRDVSMVARQARYHPARLAAEMIKRVPEMYQHDYGGAPLRFYHDVVTYQSDGNKSDVEVAFAVPTYQLGARVDGRGDETTLDARVSVLDDGWNDMANAATTFGPFGRPAFIQSGDGGAEIATFQIPLSLLPGEGELAVSVKDAVTRKIGIFRQPVAIPGYTAPTLLMSDIKQATSITPTLRKRSAFIRHNFEIIPNPTHIFARNQLVHIYYELYNLSPGPDGKARFQTSIEVTPHQSASNPVWRALLNFGRLITGSQPTSALMFSIEDETDSTMTARYTALDVSQSAPGRYIVKVTVTDQKTQQTAFKSTEVLITGAVETAPPASSVPQDSASVEIAEPGTAQAQNDPALGGTRGQDPPGATARPNQDWDALVRILKAPQYVMTAGDSSSTVFEDSTIANYIADAETETPAGRAGLVAQDRPEHYADMVYVPAGMFLMGSDSSHADEGPMQSVYLPAFYMDRHEVTNAAYVRFVEETGHEAPAHWTDGRFAPGEDQYPVVGISWYDAQAYARWAGKRLPTEAEWEKAARGDDGRTYPWGDAFAPNWLNVKGDGDAYPAAAPVGSYAEGISPYGAYDLSGNVEEWTADWFDRYNGNDRSDPAYGQQYRVIRGGSWINYDGNTRTFNRGKFYPSDTSLLLGFRCARDARQEDENSATVRGYGYLIVATPGSWADIYVDDEIVGQTPQADPIRLRPGPHRLKLINPFFAPAERDIDIKADIVQKERIVLVRKGTE